MIWIEAIRNGTLLSTVRRAGAPGAIDRFLEIGELPWTYRREAKSTRRGRAGQPDLPMSRRIAFG